MRSERLWKVVALVTTSMTVGTVLVGTPAGAHVANWAHNWTEHIRPRTDARYFTKTQADSRYYSKTQADTRYYTKTQADSRYYSKTQADTRYYTKAQVDAMIADLLSKAEAESTYVPRRMLGSVGGGLRWGRIRDLGTTVEVYIDNESTVFPTMSVVRTDTGVYEVTIPGVVANGAFHGVLVSPQQGQTTVFRACKVFQTVSAGDPADTLRVRVRCYDQTGALANSDFHILVLQ